MVYHGDERSGRTMTPKQASLIDQRRDVKGNENTTNQSLVSSSYENSTYKYPITLYNTKLC